MGSLTKPLILVVVIYLLLKFVVPNIPGSAPLPSSLIFLYLMLTVAGIVIYYTMSGESKDAFWGPIQRFLTGENIGALQTARYAVLILFPLLVGWQTYGSTAVSDAPPPRESHHPSGAAGRIHRSLESGRQNSGQYHAGQRVLRSLLLALSRRQFRRQGPAARGFNPPPANFSDPTTIAMLQESYLFWRIKKGGVGLPIEGMPWKSAMPRWEVELPDEWIWKIILGEYDGAHQSPRTWE